VPLAWPVCLGGAAACIFVMKGLPPKAWERFLIWLAIGLALYFLYGYRHSRLHVRRPPSP
jgi:APA family basic amino acid/polyamine antiporter